ncbi:MAG: hypothetical protein AAF911_09025 [Planctomycetota bacterium]
MEWIPVILAYWLLAVVVGIICVTHGLLYRGSVAARRGGLLVIAMVVVAGPTLNALAGGVAFSGKIFLASPLVFGVIALALSWRKTLSPMHCTGCGYDLRGSRDATHCPECGKVILSAQQIDQKLRRERLRVKIVLGTLTLGIAFLLGWWVTQTSIASAKTAKLLAGESGPQLELIRLEYQQRRVVITDPSMLRWIESRFAEHDTTRADAGTTYRLTLDYHWGGKARYTTYWGQDGFSMSFKHSDGWPTHQVVLLPADDARVAALLTFINEPYPNAQGKVMMIDSAGVRFDFDPGLISP